MNQFDFQTSDLGLLFQITIPHAKPPPPFLHHLVFIFFLSLLSNAPAPPAHRPPITTITGHRHLPTVTHYHHRPPHHHPSSTNQWVPLPCLFSNTTHPFPPRFSLTHLEPFSPVTLPPSSEKITILSCHFILRSGLNGGEKFPRRW